MCSRRVLVSMLAVFLSRSRMVLCLLMFAHTVMMLGLMVMMRGGMVVSGG
jgi:hypothetical protein